MLNNKQLHWSSRVALVRHNLHAASRSGDFHFFKTLQANGFVEGTNHVATLSAELGDEADTLLAAMDNLNAGLAYVHQDAFKNVYDNLKINVSESEDAKAQRSKLYVDITMQRNMADMAIDKMTSSAIALINQQPAHVQESAANVWITGATIASDCMQICLKEMFEIENKMDDFIRLEESWNSIKASVVSTVTGVKAVFSLMDATSPAESQKSSQRNSSIASASGAVFRRLSNAFTAAPSSSLPSRSSSIASAPGFSANFANHSRNASISSMGPVYRTPNYVRNSVSAGCPTSLPANGNSGGVEWAKHKLSMIPPTPAAESDQQMDPFDNSVPPLPEMPKMPEAIALDIGVGPAGETLVSAS